MCVCVCVCVCDWDHTLYYASFFQPLHCLVEDIAIPNNTHIFSSVSGTHLNNREGHVDFISLANPQFARLIIVH